MLAKQEQPNNMLGAYFDKNGSGWLPSVQCLSFSWLPAGCKFHSVGRQLDANSIQSAASQMQISFSR